MQAKLAKAVRAHFAQQMTKRLPAFQLLAKGNPDLYILQVSQDLVFFVYLSISEGKDSFVLEVAANENKQFPWTEMPGTLRNLETGTTKKMWRFRISKLWGEPKSHAWILGEVRNHQRILDDVRNKAYLAPEELESKLKEVESKVRDAVDKVCEYGIPYLELVAKKHGIDANIVVAPA